MNIRQFAYFLVGFFVCVLVYSVTQAIYPPIGVYAVVPAIPFGLFFAYLALGKFNGRDSEIYVLKAVIYFTKPRKMKYQRNPDYSEIDKKAAEWTFEKVAARWNIEVSKQKEIDSSEYNTFEQADYPTKVSQIRNLAKTVNEPTTTVMMTVKERERQLEQTQKKIREAENAARAAREAAAKQAKKEGIFKLKL